MFLSIICIGDSEILGCFADWIVVKLLSFGLDAKHIVLLGL